MSRFPLLLTLAVSLAAAAPASAVEYRLQVAGLYRQSFTHYIDGPIGTGSGELVMERLEKDLDAGSVARGALLFDRTFRYGWEALAVSFGAAKVIAEIKPLESPRRWDEVVWDGRPGERSVWVIAPSTTRFQEVLDVALKGSGPGLRYYVPYNVTANPRPQVAVGYPLVFLQFYEGPSGLWERHLSRSVSLAQGVAAVVGVSQNPSFADWVYIVVEQPAVPTTFKAVVGWDRRRSTDRSNIEGLDRR